MITPKASNENGQMIPEYAAWRNMLGRCFNPKVRGYSYYGGSGITVTGELLTFAGFWAALGPRPSSKHSVDRIDTRGNYCAENVRWASKHEQMRNRTDNVYWTFQGETLTQSAWAERFKISQRTLWARLHVQKMAFADALLTPLRSPSEVSKMGHNARW